MSAPRRDMGPNAAWEAAMSFVAGPVIGYFLDEWLGTSPWLLLALTVIGAGAGFRRLFSIAPPPPPSDDGGPDGGPG